MTDIVERLRIIWGTELGKQSADEIESLRQQLADANRRAEYWKAEHLAGNEQLAECQAREKVLRDALTWYGEEAVALAVNMTAKNDMAILASVHVLALDAGKRSSALPSDSTALDTMLKQAKREALLDVVNEFEHGNAADLFAATRIRRMAKELE